MYLSALRRYNRVMVRMILLLCLIPAFLFSANPDLVLITLDTVRVDRLSVYRYSRETTPVLADYSEKADRYVNAYSPVPLTLPAHVSMLSGSGPEHHGVLLNGLKIPPSVRLLTEDLVNRGYDTGAAVSSSVLAKSSGISRGFRIYDDLMTEAVGGDVPNQRPANETIDRAIELIKELRQPRFIWVHLFDPHAPYTPPEPYRSRFEDPYDAEIAFMDHELARFLETIPAEAMVVIVGDHGEMLGERGESEHGVFLYQSAVRVPLMIRYPGQKEGGVNQEMVSLTGMKEFVEGGISGTPRFPTTDSIYLSSYYGTMVYGFEPVRGLLSYPYKLLWTGEETLELYDLKSDPNEKNNLKEKESRQVREMFRELKGLSDPSSGMSEEDPEAQDAIRSLGYLLPGKQHETLVPPRDGLKEQGVVNEARELYRLEQKDKARTMLKDVLSRNPRHSDALHLLAKMGFEEGDFTSAVEYANRIIGYQPFRSSGYELRGRAYLGMGKTPEAERDLTQSLDIDPANVIAIAGLMNLYLDTGRKEEVKRLIAHVNQNEISHPLIFRAEAYYYEKEGEFESAFRAQHRVYLEYPGDIQVLRPLAHYAEMAGYEGQAYIYWITLLKLDPYHVESLYRAARLGLKLNKDVSLNYRRLLSAYNRCGGGPLCGPIAEEINKLKKKQR